MKKTKTLLIIATTSLLLMIVIAFVMSIIAIRTANKRPVSLEQIVIQSHDIEFILLEKEYRLKLSTSENVTKENFYQTHTSTATPC